MIKKILLVSAVLSSSLFAASFEDNIKNLIEKQTHAKVKIVSSTDLKDSKNLKVVVVEIADGGAQRVPMFATSDGNTIIGLSNIFFTASKADEDIVSRVTHEAMAYNESGQKEAAGKLINALSPDQYITLKSSAKNPKTYFIVADPNCGYCREELRNVEDRLKTHNVNMVMVGILGEDSQKKAAYLMDNVKSNMSESDKLKNIRKVFSSNFKAPAKIDVSKVATTTESLFKTGVIRGVPYIYEVEK